MRTGPGDWIARAGLRTARRILVAITGATVVAAGVLMLVTPGPGWVGILLGLAILASEFTWARRVLVRARRLARSARASVKRRMEGGDDGAGEGVP